MTLQSWKNWIDFSLRSWMTWSPPCRGPGDLPEVDRQFQEELSAFFQGFSEKTFECNKTNVRLLDVGTRNFASAAVLASRFEKRSGCVEIHGLELDAFRRMRNLRTRASYGRYYAAQLPAAVFHPMDFLDWKEPCDFLFLLNPFVTPGPLLRWGLPLSRFRPEQLFRHAQTVLSPYRGKLITSAPTEEEGELVRRFAEAAGFVREQQVVWTPPKSSAQKQPRYGESYLLR